MIRNYLTVALRNLRRQPGYSFINILGLAIGLAACVLILLYVRHELSYDQHHAHADRIYRINLDAAINGREVLSATTSAPMAATLTTDFPEVEAAARILEAGRILISHDDRTGYEEGFLWADAAIFDVFTLPFLRGDPATALAEPNTVVLTASTARRYFGERNPVGQTLRFESREELTVTGVIEDVPASSHFTFDFLGALAGVPRAASPAWINNGFYTYLRLRAGTAPATLEAKFPAMVRRYVVPQIEEVLGQSFEAVQAAGLRWGYALQPLSEIHLYSDVENEIEVQGEISAVYVISAVALFILLIACINFMNLATARAANRAKEVGLRKVLGSDRRQLMLQFLGESVLLALLAVGVALVLIVILLPFFNDLTGQALAVNATALAFLVGTALVAGLLSGVYPAVVLSAFQPAAILKGRLRRGAGGARMRSALVVTQFAISIALLVGTGVVFDQIRYMQQKRLGFAQEQVVTFNLETEAARARFEAVRERLLDSPHILSVAASSGIPGRFNSDTVFRPEGAANEQVYNSHIVRASHEFVETLGLELVAGRSFSRARSTDTRTAFLLNEAAVRLMGLTPEEAVGKQFAEIGGGPDDTDLNGHIIGVVRDFHFASLHEAILPVAINVDPDDFYYVSVRVRPEAIEASLDALRQVWQTVQPEYPFAYRFLDEDFGRLFEQEQRLGRIYGAFTVLAAFIACLGLFGLASFMTQQRTKEIGVRKVLGASVPQIVLMLSREFTRLVLIAIAVAFPVAYIGMDRWLQDFAYRVELSWWTFAAAGVAALLVAFLTVSYQSIKAAVADPVQSLRYE